MRPIGGGTRGAPFRDRRDAGRQLAERIRRLDLHDPVVIALPRGGVPVGFEVAQAINAPLDTLVVRKLGSPANPEYAVGAAAEGGMVLVGQPRDPSVTEEELQQIVRRETLETARRVARYRGTRPLTSVAGRDVILVDDGIATGLTALAAARALRTQRAKRVILAAPVCSADILRRFRNDVDDVICVQSPLNLMAVGPWYVDFTPTSDEEVVSLLRAARRDGGPDSQPEMERRTA